MTFFAGNTADLGAGTNGTSALSVTF